MACYKNDVEKKERKTRVSKIKEKKTEQSTNVSYGFVLLLILANFVRFKYNETKRWNLCVLQPHCRNKHRHTDFRCKIKK